MNARNGNPALNGQPSYKVFRGGKVYMYWSDVWPSGRLWWFEGSYWWPSQWSRP